MKQKFSPKWKASRQPRKQRKYRAQAPLHVKRKLVSAHLSKELRKKYAKRAVVLKKGDIIKIMRGSFKGKQGKIMNINVKKIAVYVEGIQRTRKDGTKVSVAFHPSNLLIITLNLEDKKRVKVIERKQERQKEKKGGEG